MSFYITVRCCSNLKVSNKLHFLIFQENSHMKNIAQRKLLTAQIIQINFRTGGILCYP